MNAEFPAYYYCPEYGKWFFFFSFIFVFRFFPALILYFLTDNQQLMATSMDIDLDELNNSTYCKPFKNAGTLVVGDKYKVLNLDIISTKYGDRVLSEVDTFKCVLPERYYTFKCGSRMEAFNEKLKRTDIYTWSA